jgi:hypothetical protein
MHYNELDHIHEKIAFLTDIIKANRLHEPDCAAFSLPKDHSGPFGSFASMSESQCHCWLDKDNIPEPGQAFSWYRKETEELHTEGYLNRFHTLNALLKAHPDLSRDKKSENYWGKTYYLIPVTINSTESTE